MGETGDKVLPSICESIGSIPSTASKKSIALESASNVPSPVPAVSYITWPPYKLGSEMIQQKKVATAKSDSPVQSKKPHGGSREPCSQSVL